MKDYAMYTPRGNELVHKVVVCARAGGWDWEKVCRHLELLGRAHPTAAREATDTAVREEVWAALYKS